MGPGAICRQLAELPLDKVERPVEQPNMPANFTLSTHPPLSTDEAEINEKC